MFSHLFENEDGSSFIQHIEYNKNGNPICVIEDCYNSAHNKGKNHGGYLLVCKAHYKGEKGANAIKGGYKAKKKSYCENMDGRLGFECSAEIHDDSMLTVDHIDEDHYNNEDKNLHTLCHNCHNYKTRFYGRVKSYDEMTKIMDKNRKKFK
jgi:hypothetical protein